MKRLNHNANIVDVTRAQLEGDGIPLFEKNNKTIPLCKTTIPFGLLMLFYVKLIMQMNC